jgi:hypothetical protein
MSMLGGLLSNTAAGTEIVPSPKPACTMGVAIK